MDNFIDILTELKYETSRSSGKGGQNVNKLETKVSLVWNFNQSSFLTETQKALIRQRAKSYLFKEGIRISSKQSRSQFKNKQNCIIKLQNLLDEWLKADKERKPTKLPKSVKEKRLKDKKRQSDKKKFRGKYGFEE
ncbi:MAG TPA: aminoacyl-tRNA hydrolase [Crocinitomix sp.]|nr:aminoacyl-tRNA hydrolase [Crocinitomix sp.]